MASHLRQAPALTVSTSPERGANRPRSTTTGVVERALRILETDAWKLRVSRDTEHQRGYWELELAPQPTLVAEVAPAARALAL